LIKIRHVAGHGAAIAVTPYLLIKILWTFGLFLPTGKMDEANWRVINATTAVLAAIGILLAMAFTRPWGERLPAWLVALPVWIGTGFLVPLLLLAPVLGPAAMARDQEAGSADVWAYEQGLVMMSLVGVGIGLPLALAGYTRARWPEAVSGPLDVGMPAGATRDLQFVLARIAVAGTLALGVIKVFWAAGGTLGLDPAMLDDRDVWWHMLSLSTGVWALAGTWGLLALVARRGSRGFQLPMAAAWVSSGMLFSYNLYDLLAGTMPDALPNPEYPLAQVLTAAAGMILGVMMGMIILLVLHDRQRAMRGVS
jgi:hypothetical protein